MNRNCELEWDLTVYLVGEGWPIIRNIQVRVLSQMLFDVFSQKKMMVDDSEDIILADEALRELVDMPYLHVIQLKSKIMQKITLKDEGRRTTGYL